MPDKKGRFTPQEQTFVAEMIAHNNPTEAARRAGFTQPASRGGALMQRPALVAEIQAAQSYRLKTEGAEIGVGTLIEIAKDGRAPAASRVMAARELVKLSGVAADAEGENKPLHAMSRAELVDAANKARQALAELDAPVIEGEIVPAGGVFE